MYAKLLGELIHRLDLSDRIKRDLGFELTAEILSLFFTHYLLLLTAGYHLKLLSENWGPLYCASNLNNIGNIFLDKGQFKDALKYYQKSLELEEKMGQRMALATTHYNLGIVFLNLRNNSVSIVHFLKSIALRSQMDLPPNKSVDQVIKIRSQIGSQKFKELVAIVFNSLPEDLKRFIKLEEYTSDTTAHRVAPKIGRNDPCPCGSGRKYKKCHGK